MRSIRQRLSSSRSCEIANEQKLNFAPYSKGKAVMKTSQKHQSWTVKLVCLSNMDATKVPCSAAERELLVQAGLGEKKVSVPDVTCSAEQFKNILVKTFPKLEGCGGFELLKCTPNTKELSSISFQVSQSPAMLKSVVGSGRLFIRPLQQNLQLDTETISTLEASSYTVKVKIIILSVLLCLCFKWLPG